MLPVFIEKGDTAEEVIERSDFKQIWGVLAALKAHDEKFANELNQLRTEMGRKGDGFKVEGLDKVVFDLPRSIESSLALALKSELVNATTSSWEEWFGRLQFYIDTYGDTLVPALFKTDDGYSLGSWVSSQRSRKESLSPDKRRLLESLDGWVWNQIDSQWEAGFEALNNYIHKFGNALVPAKFKNADGYPLGVWVNSQRTKKTSLQLDKKKRLEGLKDWVWNQIEHQWETGFEKLQDYIHEHGNSLIKQNFKTADGYPLGSWVTTQRSRAESLSADKKARLEALNGWVWDPLEHQWETAYSALQQYINDQGHALVPKLFVTSEGFPLGGWVVRQRFKKELLSDDRRARLELINSWVWDTFENKWEVGFDALQKHVQMYGNAQVPAQLKTQDGFGLGAWVVAQRSKSDSLPADKKSRLENLAGWVWNPLDQQWEVGFSALQNYLDKHGDTLVPKSFVTPDDFPLGGWVGNQRSNRNSMPIARRVRLEGLIGWVWDVNDFKWQAAFDALIIYVQEHGNAIVPAKFKTPEGFSLGAWVIVQRSQKESLPPERKRRLETIKSWVWTVNNS